jgi:hypothetical protein
MADAIRHLDVFVDHEGPTRQCWAGERDRAESGGGGNDRGPGSSLVGKSTGRDGGHQISFDGYASRANPPVVDVIAVETAGESGNPYTLAVGHPRLRSSPRVTTLAPKSIK